MSPKNGQAEPGLPFPLAAGDRAEYAGAVASMDGACRVLRALEPEDHPTEHGARFRVQCLNGGARHGQEFDAYESELSK